MATPSLDPTSRLAQWTANAIHRGFLDYLEEFDAITARARTHFENRDWRGHRRDAYARLGLVSDTVWRTMLRLRTQLGHGVHDKALWTTARSQYAELVAAHPAPELAETFFNSVTRRIFTTVGVDPEIEFVSPHAQPAPPKAPIFRTWRRDRGSEALLREILSDLPFAQRFQDLEADAREGAALLDRQVEESGAEPFDEVEVALPIFYRGKSAYRIGRIRRGDGYAPFVLALQHDEGGVTLDAVLLTERDARVLFSFTRSYFHVSVQRPVELVEFIQSILPMRRRSELYISLGYNKHGKTELYRELLAHLASTREQFEAAAGDRGMVMIVFTLPSLDLVFKVIRDRIAPPKSTTADEVKQKYNLVFRQDRAGRLVDAQEFEHLEFEATRFSPEVLKELLSEAPSRVRLEGDCVVIGHLYVERRVRPLNLYLREVDEQRARDAVLDYGQSIRDLAATNTFPGDLLLKNFGVTRNGRVIFYDYDEMALVTDCRFRELPTPRDDEDEMSSEPWFFVDQHDIFPEEFVRFLGLTDAQEAALRQAHGELLTAAFWRGIQEQLGAGEIVDIYPYPQCRRLKHAVEAGEPTSSPPSPGGTSLPGS